MELTILAVGVLMGVLAVFGGKRIFRRNGSPSPKEAVRVQIFVEKMRALGELIVFKAYTNANIWVDDIAYFDNVPIPDYTRPTAPTTLSAIDTPNDQGGSVTLSWSAGITAQPLEPTITDDNGNFRAQVLVLPGDLTGPRTLIATVSVATGTGLTAKAPFMVTLNGATLPGHKLCPYCRNPMPDYEVQCPSCGARARS